MFLPQDDEARKKLVQELHLLKTDLFMELVETGAMPLRAGVKRLVRKSRTKAQHVVNTSQPCT